MTLSQEGFEEELVERMLHSHGVLIEGILKALMRELHGFTWSAIQGKGVRAEGVRWLTRLIFHCLMSPIVKQIEERVGDRPIQRQA